MPRDFSSAETSESLVHYQVRLAPLQYLEVFLFFLKDKMNKLFQYVLNTFIAVSESWFA